MTTTTDAPDVKAVEQLTQTSADLTEVKEKQSEWITLLEQRLAHLREEWIIETNVDLGGDQR